MEKKTFSIFIDKKVSEEFERFCYERNLHKPRVLERILKEFIKNGKKKGEKLER